MNHKSRIPESRPLLKFALGMAALLSVGLICLCMSPTDAGTSLVLTGLGMAVTANQLVVKAEEGRIGLPVAASTTLYQGTLAFVNTSGYVNGTAANEFAGVVIEYTDNSGGSNGDLNVELWTRGVFTLTGSGFSQASVGKNIFATDNYTITESADAGILIGRCVGYISATQIKVEIQGKLNAEKSVVEAKTANFTVTAGESGKTFTTVGATGTVVATLPPAVVGLKYRFRVGAAQALQIDPDGTETIALPSTGVQSAAGKYIAADADGETVSIECTKAGQWSVFGFTGTWTAES